MSYCRWIEGDLYCYHHSNGYATHVRNGAGLSHDGQTFQDRTSLSFLARLLTLKNKGYQVPEHAIQRARNEWIGGEK